MKAYEIVTLVLSWPESQRASLDDIEAFAQHVIDIPQAFAANVDQNSIRALYSWWGRAFSQGFHRGCESTRYRMTKEQRSCK